MRVEVPRRLGAAAPAAILGAAVTKIDRYDGTKIYLDDGSWALLRFSGTEPVLRLFAEAGSPERAQALADWLTEFVSA